MARPMGGPGGMPKEKSKDFKGSMIRILKQLRPWRALFIISLMLAMTSVIFSLIAPNKLSDLTDEITKGINVNTEVLEIISVNVSTSTEIEPITYNGVEISVKDQLETVKVLSESKELKDFHKLPDSVYKLVEGKIDREKVNTIIIIMICLYGVGALFSYIEHYSMTTISNRFAQSLRTKISYKINKLPLKYFDSHETGDMLSRVTNDVDLIGHHLNQSMAALVANITLFLGSLFMMIITNWIMALTAVASTIIGFLCMSLILKTSQKYFDKKQKDLGKLNGYIEEIYSGHIVVKAYNGMEEAKENFDKLNYELYDSNKKSQFLSGLMMPIMGFVGNFGYVMVCVVGALLVTKEMTSFGTIVAFMIYIRMFTNPLSQIAQAMTNLQSTVAASERVFEFLDEKEMSDQKEISKHLDISKVKGHIEFKNVKFGYDKGKTIINDFSVNVSPGQKIAIVGPTGAGKTTLVNLLMKFYEINGGDIIIDGVSIKDLSRENIHDLFIMVLQDTWLFDGTINENIKYNREDVTDREVWSACKTVGIEHFIKTLPGGLNASIADNDTISSGQKQLFTIARGMLKDAPFLILDEATSNVDTRTEELVQKAMDKLTEGRTSFIIAHRLSTIKNADLILVMNEGNIIEQGTHDELMKDKGFYAELYNSQFSKGMAK